MDPIVSPRLPLVTIQTFILDAAAVIDQYRNGSALFLDEQRRLLTAITGGDIRRAILAGDRLTQPILKQGRKNVPPAPPSANVSRSVRPHAAKVVERKIKVVGVGAGGHAKVVIDILSYSPRVHVVGLVELATRLFGETIEGSLILGDDTLLPQLLAEGVGSAFIGIGGVGDNLPRAQAYDRILKLGFDLITAIHPRAVVARTAKLGRGVTITAGVVGESRCRDRRQCHTELSVHGGTRLRDRRPCAYCSGGNPVRCSRGWTTEPHRHWREYPPGCSHRRACGGWRRFRRH